MLINVLRKTSLVLVCLTSSHFLFAQKQSLEASNQTTTPKQWTTEAEDNTSKVTWQDGVADIQATRGLTLWFGELMKGNVTIEYEAQIVGDGRLSDLNCFWMANKRGGYGGKFENNYALQLYYVGYGGNNNTTTRFRRYNGKGACLNNKTAVNQSEAAAKPNEATTNPSATDLRPRILREYTDPAHLLKADHWYKIRLQVKDGRVGYWIDGEQLVDYVDPAPLTQGYFGFRTTQSHARLRNFSYTFLDPDQEPIVLRWVGGKGSGATTFGVPFSKGEIFGSSKDASKANTKNENKANAKDNNPSFTLKTDKGEPLTFDTWPLAYWPDGSIKWQAFCTLVPEGTDSCLLTKGENKDARKSRKNNNSRETKKSRTSSYSSSQSASTPLPFGGGMGRGAFGSQSASTPLLFGEETGSGAYVTLNGKREPLLSSELESQGSVRTVRKFTGKNFIIRTYQYKGSNEMKIVHTLLVDSALNHDGLSELSLHFPVAMHGPCYERFVKFDDYSMSVEPLISRRKIDLEKMDSTTQLMLANIARWDGFRLSQLSANGYSIRKRSTPLTSWVGTKEGTRSQGCVTLGDSTSAISFRLHDFWQSYPATLQVDGAREDTAWVTLSLHSPEAEPFSFAPYDTVAHHLLAAYEDVQPGMSTAYGMARTSEITIQLEDNTKLSSSPATSSETSSARVACTPLSSKEVSGESLLVCTPEYFHRKRAFGIWSLPTVTCSRDSLIESTLTNIMHFYEREIERNSWYGFWNYGDVMHGYDSSRDEWRYDVGGYAWDNTELGSPSMLWYQFLRTGDPAVYRMARAMTRHCSEVDVYHDGPHAGLGSRHNVVHWGCGAKESRISEAWWNRFMYYLTADERLGDLMHAVVDADTILLHLDPMRLAQPRNEYPCTAPARLRLGPDWLGYASNWFTEIERTNTLKIAQNATTEQDGYQYAKKLFTGMKCIADFPHGFFEGPLALGYYPATGQITNECDSTVLHTNHLMAIMGGFELMNEMENYFTGYTESKESRASRDNREGTQNNIAEGFFERWLEHCRDYKHLAKVITHNSFLVPRLTAYAAWRLGDQKMVEEAWGDVLKHQPYLPGISQPWRENWSGSVTNDNATWTLDAIFLKEISQ